MLIHLIRHAHAGSRKDWKGDDELRPLSRRGERQAEVIDRALADAGIDLLWSSRFVRCVQTLDPLAHRLGLAVDTTDDLTEGGSGPKALDALLAAAEAGHVVAASSHGDVIPEIVDEAVRRGAELHGPSSPSKAARYELTVVDGRVTHLRHVPAPDGHT
ncbi:histidine phosphatase family protein [Aquihabitans sp. G128]|uniref:SixA phosphatase family protein n=1 Tax=Aquihabitans sp. G128 TaxID=2849779 RepID=UPI001C225200|nr:phosphoglycerate mutase family protein [Aquihabitans sp. G128]QXC60953.1 histidine phosphatase family protein [Aquihabitans sp. G128]